ncbi:MAG: NUDIX hydrolase [Anaerolineae bacterium]|nr:NUDIX hydrolase [Anaerolineae bacterium]
MINRRTVANWLKRLPWTGELAIHIMRLWQPWRTVGAVGVVYNDKGEVLIVEHVFHPKYPWGLPGGWMSRKEDPADTVRREVQEETGLNVQVIRPLLVEHTPFLSRHLDICYLCYAPVDAGEVKLSSELLAYRWIDPHESVPLVRFHARAVAAAFEQGVFTKVAV